MVLGIFKSKRERVKSEGIRMFDNYIPALRGMSGEEIGSVLDMAAGIKSATTMYGTRKDDLALFEDPMIVSQDTAFRALDMWKQHMWEEGRTIEGRAKTGALAGNYPVDVPILEEYASCSQREAPAPRRLDRLLLHSGSGSMGPAQQCCGEHKWPMACPAVFRVDRAAG